MDTARRARTLRWLALVGGLCLLVGACADPGDADPSASNLPTTTTATRVPVSTTMVVPTTTPPVWPTDGWPESTPEEQGIDSAVLADLVDYVTAAGGIDTITVVRNGYVVLDTVVYPFSAATGHDIYSCTKSVTATLIGIAIDRGLLAGVDVPVVEVLSDAASDEVDQVKASMTVEDLLTMSTGLDCRDSYRYRWQGLNEMTASDGWAAHVLALPMVDEPGTRFEYCNGASYLLSAIVTEVTGRSAAEFAAEVLFEPLGITEYLWPASPRGITLGWGGLVLRPADMAKIGYLYLRGGEWDGDQIVSEAWIAAATTNHIDADGIGYGYQWWVADAGYYMAQGLGGQYILTLPDRDLVVVFTSGLPGDKFAIPEMLVTNLAAGMSDEPLEPNPEGVDRMAAAVAAAASGPELASIDLPEVAASVNGSRYDFRSNPYGHEWFMLSFDGDSASLDLQIGTPMNPLHPAGRIDIEIGLDGRFIVGEALGASIATRGFWVGASDDIFLIEFQFIGQAPRGNLQIRFDDDTARFRLHEPIQGISQSSIADKAG